MKLNLELELQDVFGGDGNLRMVQKEVPKLSRSKKTTRTKSGTGLSRDMTTNEVLTELKNEQVHTFKRDVNDNPILRLGGCHGKFWGAMKSAGILLNEMGDEEFPSKAYVGRMMEMVFINPIEPILECNGSKLKEVQLSQKMAGFGNTMVFPWYDVISSCKVKITIEYPNHLHEKIIKMLDQVQKSTHFNKRRTIVKIGNLDELKKHGK